MNKNGFTLIELLAVIVVLAILLVIAVPRVLDVIESARIETFRISTEQLVKSAKDRMVVNSLVEPQSKKIYTIHNGAFVGDSLPFDGELPDSGKIYVVSDSIAAIAVKEGNYCGVMQLGEEKARVEIDTDCELNVPGIVPDSCFTFATYGNEVHITDYDNSCPKDVIIPSSYNGINVVLIGNYAFDGKELTSIELPSTVRWIEWNAFENNLLETISFEDNLETIGYRAFANNKLKAAIFPNSLTLIDAESFMDNEIISLTIPSSVTSMQWNAFKNNHISDLKIENGITYIGSYSFNNNNLEEIVIPSSVTNIYEAAFSNDMTVSNDYRNNIKKVTIPSGVNVHEMAISPSFKTCYDTENSKAAGVYTATSQSGTWTKQ